MIQKKITLKTQSPFDNIGVLWFPFEFLLLYLSLLILKNQMVYAQRSYAVKINGNTHYHLSWEQHLLFCHPYPLLYGIGGGGTS